MKKFLLVSILFCANAFAQTLVPSCSEGSSYLLSIYAKTASKVDLLLFTKYANDWPLKAVSFFVPATDEDIGKENAWLGAEVAAVDAKSEKYVTVRLQMLLERISGLKINCNSKATQ